MKKIFVNPEIEVSRFLNESITAASSLNGKNIGKEPGSEYVTGSVSFNDFSIELIP